MQIQIKSDDRVCCDAELMRRIEGVIEGMLEPFADRVTRVEVGLSDLNSTEVGSRDKCCTIEARLAGLKPLAVGHEAATLAEAIHGAAAQLRRSLGDYIRDAEAAPPQMLAAGPADQDA